LEVYEKPRPAPYLSLRIGLKGLLGVYFNNFLNKSQEKFFIIL